MTLVGHRRRRIGGLAGALVLVVALLAAATPAGAATVPASPTARAVVAFVPDATLDGFERMPGASVAMLGATQGRYRQIQALLDLSQGARTSLAAYQPPEPPPLGVLPDGTVAGWPEAVRRADAAPAEIVPGLLASSIPGGAGYAGQVTASRDPAIPAADRAGRIAAMTLVEDPAQTAPAALALLRGHRLVLARLPDGAALRELLAARPAGTLVIAMAEPPPTVATRLLPVAVFGLGAGSTLTSRTTRTHGLVTGIDVAPTVLDWLRLPVPGTMTGQPVELDGTLDVAALRSLHARLRVVTSRRYATLGYLAAAWALLALGAGLVARRRGLRWAVRTGALAVLWLLPVLLVFAALSPARLVEEIGVGLVALGLGALSDRLVRWPLAPALPGLIGAAAYVVDLAFGSHLIVRSLLGPNPLFGSRFYGIGNELEATLPVLLLCGIAAAACALGRGRRSGALALAYAVGGLVLGAALGSGRLGADVGGVITVGAGAAVAVLLALPGRVSGRRIAVVALVPIVALVALAVLDLATGGDSHFTRSVLRADDREALEDVIRRRYRLAYNNLESGVMPLLTALSLAAIGWAVWRRDRLLDGVPGADAWGAALAGSAAAGVAGALSNDSGPLLLVFATFVAVWVLAYLRNGPDRRVL
jgi:hypothetical protein